MKQHFTPTSRGYTLIELLVYVALIGTLLSAVMIFFSVAANSRVKNQTIIEINDQAAAIMDQITQTIRNATSVTSPAAGASGASLTLAMPTGSVNPTVFDVSANALRIKEGTNAAVNITNNDVQISSLSFKNLAGSGTSGVVQVSFTMSRVNPNNQNEYDYQKTFTSSAEVGW